MKKKLLGCALICALGVTQYATAQDYDDRWYVAPSVGLINTDGNRHAKNDIYYSLGVGKFFTENFSLDIDLNTTSPDKKGTELHWNNYGVMFTGRYHFRSQDRTWAPYLAFGAGVLRHEEEYSDPAGGQPFTRKGNNVAAQVGAGFQADYSRTAIRAELLGRYDGDNRSIESPRENGFLDVIGQLSMLVKLGDAPSAPKEEVAPPPPPPPPPPPSCEDLDDDGDGVNNCDDRCPDTPAGTLVGPDGCPVPVSIDLRGVNFDFDKATLRADATATLDEAINLLVQYPQLQVEVAGHTDLCGAESYNQTLSERRAQTVYSYLVDNGVDASRLIGPNGYGESRPLESTPQTSPACRSEVNRRTELNVQN